MAVAVGIFSSPARCETLTFAGNCNTAGDGLCHLDKTFTQTVAGPVDARATVTGLSSAAELVILNFIDGGHCSATLTTTGTTRTGRTSPIIGTL